MSLSSCGWNGSRQTTNLGNYHHSQTSCRMDKCCWYAVERQNPPGRFRWQQNFRKIHVNVYCFVLFNQINYDILCVIRILKFNLVKALRGGLIKQGWNIAQNSYLILIQHHVCCCCCCRLSLEVKHLHGPIHGSGPIFRGIPGTTPKLHSLSSLMPSFVGSIAFRCFSAHSLPVIHFIPFHLVSGHFSQNIQWLKNHWVLEALGPIIPKLLSNHII